VKDHAAAHDLTPADRNEVRFPAIPLIAAMVSSLLVGGIAVAFGPLLPLLQVRFVVSLPVAGTAVSAFYGGAVGGSLVILLGVELVRGGTLLAAAFTALGAGAIGIATASFWPILLASVFLLGIGFGSLDTGLNQFMARTERRHRAARVNLLNAMYPIGAVLGPIVVTALGLARFSMGYVGVGVASLLGAVAMRGVVAPRTQRSGGSMPPVGSSRGNPAPGRAFTNLLVLAYVLEVGLEVGITSWLASQLLAYGHSDSFAGLVTAGFWAAIALSRFAIVPFTHRSPLVPMIVACCTIATLAIAFAAVPALAPAAYIVTGLAVGPIFPTGLVWLSEARPKHSRGLSLLLVASMIGGTVAPAIISALVAIHGLVAIPYVLMGLSLAMSAAFAAAAVVGHHGIAPG